LSFSYRLAPKYPYPIPIDDSWAATKYIYKNAEDLRIDVNKIILMGDSAGGGIVLAVMKRIIETGSMLLPILQVPIYPWLQNLDFKFPSQACNEKKDWSDVGDIKLILWYVGVKNVTKEMVEAVRHSQHLLLIDDVKLRLKYLNCIDFNLMPAQYKHGKGDYSKYISDHDGIIHSLSLEKAKIDAESILKMDKTFSKAALQLFNVEISPGFLDDEIIKKFPETYILIVQNDELKDENFVFAERLKRNGVKIKVVFSQKGYHGIISDSYKDDEALKLLNEMVEFIKSKVSI
jgi:acetyl esterase/lipase